MTDIPYANEGWNFLIGCPLPLISSGCANCWARNLHTMRHKAFLAGKKMPPQYAKPFNELQVIANRLEQPLHWKKPRRIFVLPQSDLFHPSVLYPYIKHCFEVIRQTPQHTYLIFTKRHERMARFANELNSFDNVWWISSASTQKEVHEAWLWLSEIDGNIGFSLEPLLERVVTPLAADWIIIGSESGPDGKRRPCELQWARQINRDCIAAGIPVYNKQYEINGKCEKHVINFPLDLQRREIP